MLDKELRESVRGLWQEVFGWNARDFRPPILVGDTKPLIVRIGELEREVYNLQSQANLIEKDCPVCKHKTLMKREGEAVYKNGPMTTWTTGWFDARTGKYEPHRFYCYGCGKTFREQEGLVEVE